MVHTHMVHTHGAHTHKHTHAHIHMFQLTHLHLCDSCFHSNLACVLLPLLLLFWSQFCKRWADRAHLGAMINVCECVCVCAVLFCARKGKTGAHFRRMSRAHPKGRRQKYVDVCAPLQICMCVWLHVLVCINSL